MNDKTPVQKTDKTANFITFGIFIKIFFISFNKITAVIINSPSIPGMKTNISNLLHNLETFKEYKINAAPVIISAAFAANRNNEENDCFTAGGNRLTVLNRAYPTPAES